MRWCSEVITVSGGTLAPSFRNISVVLQFHKPLFKFKFNDSFSSLSVTHRKLLVVPSARARAHPSSSCGDFDFGFVVVNFYHFVFIKDPQAEVAKHLSFLELEGLDINGRVYLNEQGINAQYSGPSKDALAYVNWLREDNRFSDILVQISPSENGHAFPTLKLRYKPSLVQFEGGISHLPLLDPSMRAIPLTPSEWRNRLKAINKADLTSKDYPNRNYILLDVRNGYEWDIGHFRGAQRPNVDCFRSTSFGLSQEEITVSDPLSNVDKEKTNILMYCTGGIRCDVYSTRLRLQGFQNLYTLKGGVSHYLKNEGPAEWVGNLFVFDSRLSLPPPVYYPQATTEAETMPVSGYDKFAKCYICSLEVSELRHRNCANLDCNLLFLCCRKCVKDLRGCCCLSCTTAPRLRPVLNGDQRYKKWHIYRDMDLQGKMEISTLTPSLTKAAYHHK
ncbi:rhodanese-like domain-containing protein 8, chloroplastic [Gastrolobium bilobum]|uniref:rhodanese-like domain-containing protein 8, chloroplastic n=1 Tax=Gastrolobium bilobum TaxID=150636 RepID=UPI002AAF4024|nr:rhodanese-like domain-containing protein 8, chloroplastic [Gastrolobium bilobum]XP_061364115.1 rhodanese-like domain-containing protein 8, chloroplastic [Gastrolobium bilobum]